MKIAGLDIGTTGCKCTVFDEKGKYLDKAYRDYPVRRATSGHEIDVSTVMDAVYEVIGKMAGEYPDIAGLGVTSFGETFVMTDEAGTPLHTSMLYTDPRGREEAQQLVDALGSHEIQQITGLVPHSMYSMPKIMWIRNHHPEIYERAAHIFLMQDYVVFHLTGEARIDYSLATRTMAFDIIHKCWSQEIFGAAGIDVRKMSQPVATGVVAGRVTREAAERTGLRPEAMVVSGAHDQVAAAVGAGVFDGNTAVDGAGTVECLTPIYDSLPDMDQMYAGNYAVVPYVVPGTYCAYAFSYTGGALIQWCADTLAKEEEWIAKKEAISINAWLEQEYLRNRGDNPSGLLVLPHFAGAATPYMDTGSKGAILGLTTDTTVSDIYRGCMEGVAYEMCLNAKRIAGSGVKYHKISATGGGAHSKIWMQMKADMLNVPITALETVDAGTVGSAMLTGVAIGLFQNLADARAHMVRERETYLPKAQMHERYMDIYERYAKVYEAVRPLMES